MSHPTILIVDDDPTDRELLARQLRRRGFAVVEAADGAAGLARLAEPGIDLVLLDLRMPGFDGLAVLAALGRRPRPPVVVISAAGEGRHVADAYDGGAADFLHRPLELPVLVSVIRRCLARNRYAA